MKLWWAIDPFESRTPEAHRAAGWVERFAHGEVPTERGAAEIEAVYALSLEGLGAFAIDEDALGKARDAALRHLVDLAHSLAPSVKSGRVLISPRASPGAVARRIADGAAESGVDGIVVASRARTGVSRTLLGSFAESLLLVSRIPVWLIPPDEHFREGADTVVFATDLSDESHEVFRRWMREHAPQGAGTSGHGTRARRLRLAHVASSPYLPMLSSGAYLLSGAYIPTTDPMTENRPEGEAPDRARLKAWAEEARAFGWDSQDVWVDSSAGVLDAILAEAADPRVTCVALAAQSGPWSAALLGSLARSLVRMSPVPVWVGRAAPPEEEERDRAEPSRRTDAAPGRFVNRPTFSDEGGLMPPILEANGYGGLRSAPPET